jgi:hypothetical protein
MEGNTITLFPQEWMRDPASLFIQSGYHDVPWGEPELIRACIRHALNNNQSKPRKRREQAAAPNSADSFPALIKPELNKTHHE